MKILSIDTSCDETSVAVTEERKILANAIYSQILIHKKWGGVVPSLAKRAHEERIDTVIEEALNKSRLKMEQIEAFAVTQGPGLAIALEVGIRKAKELAETYRKPLIAINHMEGHIYSCFAQNSQGNPKNDFRFPYLCLLVSGNHTELVIFNGHLVYEVIGETLDDAAGEALDKAARLLIGAGYPGGPVIEELAKKGKKGYHTFPRPLSRSKDLNFSFSGLKTSLFYYYKSLNEKVRLENLNNIAAAYQEAVFSSLLIKLELAIKTHKIADILVAGGVAANQDLRKKVRLLVKKHQGIVIFPQFKSIYGDNAAMIGIAAFYKASQGKFVQKLDTLDREPRLHL